MTTTTPTIKRILLTFIALALLAPAVRAQDGSSASLRDRMQKRDSQLQDLKRNGVIGETSDGYVDFVKQRDSSAGSLVDDENADRKQLYKSIAEKEKTTPELVAQRAAKRNFERARSGEYLKQDGKWVKKT